jgi:hypothetical protein
MKSWNSSRLSGARSCVKLPFAVSRLAHATCSAAVAANALLYDSQAPSQQQLRTLWRMLVALQQHYSATAHDAAAWDTLTEWGMLPLAAGKATH